MKQPVIPVWLSTILQEMYNRLLRIPAVYVFQSLASSSLSYNSNPVTPVTVNDTLQLSDVIISESPQEVQGDAIKIFI